MNNHEKKYEIKRNFDCGWVIYDSSWSFAYFPRNNGMGSMDCTISAYWNDNNYNSFSSFNSHWSLYNYQVYYIRIIGTKISHFFTFCQLTHSALK